MNLFIKDVSKNIKLVSILNIHKQGNVYISLHINQINLRTDLMKSFFAGQSVACMSPISPVFHTVVTVSIVLKTVVRMTTSFLQY